MGFKDLSIFFYGGLSIINHLLYSIVGYTYFRKPPRVSPEGIVRNQICPIPHCDLAAPDGFFHGFFRHRISAGWWFGTFFIVPFIGNNHPNWLSNFSEGWPNHQPVRVGLGPGEFHQSIIPSIIRLPIQQFQRWQVVSNDSGFLTSLFPEHFKARIRRRRVGWDLARKWRGLKKWMKNWTDAYAHK